MTSSPCSSGSSSRWASPPLAVKRMPCPSCTPSQLTAANLAPGGSRESSGGLEKRTGVPVAFATAAEIWSLMNPVSS